MAETRNARFMQIYRQERHEHPYVADSRTGQAIRGWTSVAAMVVAAGMACFWGGWLIALAVLLLALAAIMAWVLVTKRW